MKPIRIIIAIMLSLFTGSIARGQTTLNLEDGVILENTVASPPVINITQSSNLTVIDYQFNQVQISPDYYNSGTVNITIPEFGVNEKIGQPSFPLKSDKFYVPTGYSAGIQILGITYKEFNYKLSPARMPEPDNTEIRINQQGINEYNGFYPNEWVSLGNKEKYRGACIQQVILTPIKYNLKEGKVRILTSIKYAVRNDAASGTEPQDYQGLNIIDDKFISGHVVNSLMAPNNYIISDKFNRKGYLILTTTKFEAEARRFSNWKNTLGFDADIIVSNWTTASIKEAITQYAQSHPNLYYVLLVGDNEEVPSNPENKVYDSWNNYISDYRYACIDGDNLADVLIGRIPVSTAEEAATVFDKIIQYERNPPLSRAFFNNAVHASYFQHCELMKDYTDGEQEVRAFITASEESRNIMMKLGKNIERIYAAQERANPKKFNNGKDLPEELRTPVFKWDGSGDDIVKSINNGVFYVFHRDHGSSVSWGHPYFNMSCISQLTNKSMLPIVFSINCQTGKFNESRCFAEAFLRKQNGGCVAIIGATELSPSNHNNAMSVGIFKSISSSDIYEYPSESRLQLGEILRDGMEEMTSKYPEYTPGITDYERRIFHCFGDPSMLFPVRYPESLKCKVVYDDNALRISPEGGKPVISTYDNISGKSSLFRQSEASINRASIKNTSVCIRSGGYRPILLDATSDGKLYIENQTMESSGTYVAKKIKVGSSVDNPNKEAVVFKKGSFELDGEVELGPGVEIFSGVSFSAGKNITK